MTSGTWTYIRQTYDKCDLRRILWQT